MATSKRTEAEKNSDLMRVSWIIVSANFFSDMDDSSDESKDSEDKEFVENVEKRKRPTLKPAEVKRTALDVFVPETEDGSQDAVST